ncbi:FAD-binding oxidoreductase [Streptomyces sp. NPDC127077]|uniref:FAD-binding oxidoreductase n=1 Tax=Streptomyces sp. NPDC127077 TaxID=3347131 RepID=UPI0036497796
MTTVPGTSTPSTTAPAVLGDPGGRGCLRCGGSGAGNGAGRHDGVTPEDAPARAGTDDGAVESGRFRARRVAAVLRPESVEEVVRIVRDTAVRAATGAHTPLHPVSTGRNWGLGSGRPVEEGAAVLDLSRLDRVRAIDLRAGYAVVEPGVTQGELAGRLVGSERMLNLTGASQHTSVVGNILERGVGLHRGRADDLAGLELVLPDGTFTRCGWWPDEHSSTVQPHGRGPSLNHLFTQSATAVVTAAVVRLLPRPEEVRVLPLAFSEAELPAAVDTLRSWTAQRLIPPTTKIYNSVAAGTYGLRDRCLAHICLTGDIGLVDTHARLVAEKAGRHGSPFTPAPRHTADEHVHRAYAGLPDPDDTLFLRKTGHCARCLDTARGLLMFLPVVPFRGSAVARAAELIGAALQGRTDAPGVTMNVLDADTVDHVVTLGFSPRDAQAVGDAHRTLDRLHQVFAAEGHHPYRPDIDHPLPRPRGVLHERLSRALDPDGVLARGRY